MNGVLRIGAHGLVLDVNAGVRGDHLDSLADDRRLVDIRHVDIRYVDIRYVDIRYVDIRYVDIRLGIIAM